MRVRNSERSEIQNEGESKKWPCELSDIQKRADFLSNSCAALLLSDHCRALSPILKLVISRKMMSRVGSEGCSVTMYGMGKR